MNDEIEKYNSELADLQRKMHELLAKKVEAHGKIIQSQGLEITDLQQRVSALEEYRDAAIKADLLNGMKGKDVAEKYKLSPSRISQIKNSDRRH
ncbi:hypothetical protein [Neisseria elongata]|jgi:hypothetical protein|uniref:hypothetical protein n=1 Tax=Neisseria elongata TaxID=495 RepID=UPI0024B17E41|nr:hypothetical protein [Neisseria elongata]